MAANKRGLGRHIPADVSREVRRRSKQGCIFCRALLCQYEHIEPAFADARTHDPERICLVCAYHHDQITRGLISKDQVFQRYQIVQRDAGARPPFYSAILTGNLRLVLGDSLFEYMPNVAAVLQYDDEQVLTLANVQDHEFGGTRPSISGALRDANGALIVEIDDNVITLANCEFDAVTQGSRIQIRTSDGALQLAISIGPPDGFAIDRLVMRHRDLLLNFDRTFGVVTPQMSFELPALESKGATAAVSFTSDRAKWVDGLSMMGGEGVRLPGGITLAQGAGIMQIRAMRGEIRPYEA